MYFPIYSLKNPSPLSSMNAFREILNTKLKDTEHNLFSAWQFCMSLFVAFLLSKKMLKIYKNGFSREGDK